MKKLVLALFVILTGSCFGQIENTWTKMSDFSGLKRERAIAFSVNGFGYVGTGVDTAEVVYNDLWKYDASNDTWTQVASIPGEVRRNAIAFTINDKGYVGTGINSVIATDPMSVKLTDLWEYNPITNGWTAKAPFPGNGGAGIYFATAFSVGNFGYLVGGKYGPNNYSNKLFRYDPISDQWQSGPNFPGGVRYQLSSLSIGDKGYVGLGIDQDLMNNDWWEYKTTTNAWTQRADLPANSRSSATTFTIGPRGFVCMGSNGGMLGDLWEYDANLNAWYARASYGGSARKGAIAMVINNKAYVGTGKGISGKKASMHMYNPFFTVGMNELESTISTYPNPVTDEIHISTKTALESMTLTNAQGKILYSGPYTNTLKTNAYPSGTYYLSGRNNGIQQKSHKIIIQ
jgi:N-acetylneuraminic acid mutarotase